ncbi:MAG: Lrp/AsnC family transcriptional regulator [Firmicutes bacterium]|nr:Lrp/AsnC family transcriptional regulator [Bacillota bacterium]
MSAALDATDRKLLDLLQKEFPLLARPYAVLGSRTGLAEDEVCEKVAGWQKSGIVRRLGAVFDSKHLGYRSVLVAMGVPEARVEEVAAQISRWPGVTHNYLRETIDGDPPLNYNLWFTLTAPTKDEIDVILREISRGTGITDILELPARRLFKIKVEFEMSPGADRPAQKRAAAQAAGGQTAAGARSSVDPPSLNQHFAALTGQDWRIIGVLQEDLPAVPEPYAVLADRLGMRQEELQAKIREYLAAGIIRRFGATLKHQEVGFAANAMGVWRVPAEREDEVGRRMAQFRAVSHCYSRATHPRWPYNLYTMIHAQRREDCLEVARQISTATGVADYRLLFTARELKKERMRYRSDPGKDAQ